MSSQSDETIKRKKDHIKICLNEDVGFSSITTGFENYYFEHNAITEVDFNKIDLTTKFLKKKINYPFLISCMTGGTSEAEKINEHLALAAKQLNIPIGVGSQRQALENDKYISSYQIIRENAGGVPVLSNIGAAQVSQIKSIDQYKRIVELVNASALVIHVNPLQELIQKNGEPNFKGLLKNIERLVKKIGIPIIVKEVGSGTSKIAAKKLLDIGVYGIDVAGAGGTSWAQVELKRNKEENEYFRNWGLPTSYCIRQIKALKSKYKFSLIASGGISNGIDIAKSIALGADLTASARPLLKIVMNKGVDGVVSEITSWFDDVKKIMYLTGSKNLKELSKQKLIHRTEIY
ncbi:MAG TPA: type 2 isopentenyl-diphosphate Delta-isomerase [Ignavibacteria bacterium]|nr:type 2 isopentenyl-diphosphate Delta-isomerase [Ignavibacteria bacterium]